jgi:hypothetical protein
MKLNPKQATWRSLRYGFLLICCTLVICPASTSGRLLTNPVKKSGLEERSARSQSVAVRIGLKLEIVEVKQLANDVVEVTIRNGYKRDITAIAASAGDDQSFHTDYIYAEAKAYQKLAPGTSDIFLYAPSRLSGIKPQIVVSAVIFSDRTSQGDPGEVRDILDKRLGMKIQLDRMNPYLERLDKVKNSSVRAELRKTKRCCRNVDHREQRRIAHVPGG